MRHDLVQIAAVTAAAAIVIALLLSVERGLMAMPGMDIGGGPHDASLVWYQDRVNGALPRPFVLSLPLWAYRIGMLGWAIWLAFAALRWGRWIWAALRAHGLWRPLRLWRRPAPEEAEEAPEESTKEAPEETPPAR